MSPSRLVRALALALMSVLAVGGLTATPSVAASSTGSISGAVTLPTDFQVPSGFEVYLTAIQMSDAGWEDSFDATAKKAKNGTYTYSFSKLPAGSYLLRAAAVRKTGKYDYAPVDLVGTFFGGTWDMDEAPTLTLAKGGKLTGRDITLTKGATVTGSVTDPYGDGGDAYLTASVLETYDDGEDTYEEWVEFDTTWGTTASNGSYTIPGLPDATVRVCAEAGWDDSGLGWLSRCWIDATSVDTATDIPAGPAGTVTPGIDIELGEGGAITGRVIAPDVTTARDLREAEVYLFRQDDDGEWVEDWDSFGYFEWKKNATSFDYEIPLVEPGEVRVCIEVWDAASLIPTCHGGAFDPSQGTDVEVTPGGVTEDVDIEVLEGATMSGTVTLEKGVSTKGVYVAAYNMDEDANYYFGEPAPVKVVPSKGGSKAYTLGGLTPGEYLVEFYDESGYLTTQYWKDSDRYRQATLLEVADLADAKTGVNATMRSAQAITGTVTGENRKGLEDVFVTVYAEHDGAWEDTGHWGYTDSKGRYRIGGLPVGTYKLEYESWDGLVEYWNDSPTLELADTVNVVAKKTTSKIDAQLTKAGPAVSGSTPKISGTASVGTTLTAVPGTWRQNPALTYTWKVGTTTVASDEGQPTKYTVKPADYNKTITVSVTGKKDGYVDTTKTSSATKKVVRGTIATAVPTIGLFTEVQAQSLTPALTQVRQGDKVEAIEGAWSVKVGALKPYAYQWYADGKAIKGATQRELLLESRLKLVGKKLTVKVTGSADGYSSASKTSKSVKVLEPLPAPPAP